MRRVRAVEPGIGVRHPRSELLQRRRAERIRRAGGEVAAVVVAVGVASVFSEQCRGDREPWCVRIAFAAVCRAVAEEVDDVGIGRWTDEGTNAGKRHSVSDEHNLSVGLAHVDRAGDVRRRQIETGVAARSQSDQVVLVRPDDAAKRLIVRPGATRCRGVLQRPAGDVHGRHRRVIKLNVVVLVYGAAITAAAINLADDQVVGRRHYGDVHELRDRSVHVVGQRRRERRRAVEIRLQRDGERRRCGSLSAGD